MKRSSKTKSTKPFAVDAEQVNRVVADSERRGYNMLLVEGFKAIGIGWTLTPMMVHSHIAGEPAEPHIRCRVAQFGEDGPLLDVSFEAMRGLGWDPDVIAEHLRKHGLSDEARVLSQILAPKAPEPQAVN